MTKNLKKTIWPKTMNGINMNIDELNAIFQPLDFKKRLETLYQFYKEDQILYTSSFGTKSIFLLHLLHQIRPTQKVHFIDTTYHFEETINYKKEISQTFGTDVIDVAPNATENALTKEESWWEDHPKMCCTINKLAPLEPIVAKHDIWISGLMSYQTNFRSHLRVFEKQGDILKFHPLLDIDEGEFLYHLDYHKLPRHPLEEKGYGSIGCTHCTTKGVGRSGRWKDSKKDECGLHPNYFNRKEKNK